MSYFALLVVAALNGFVPANGVAAVEVQGNQFIAEIDTTVGCVSCVGYEALVVITFENPTNTLDYDSLIVQADEINPANPAIRSRLPEDTFIPADFPVKITIDPGVNQNTTASFTGRYDIEVKTPHLEFDDFSPFRLFKAPDGGAFEDISLTLGFGSFRVRGAGGQFSEFLIAAVLRPLDEIVLEKYDSLKNVISAGFSSGDITTEAIKNSLVALCTSSETNFDSNDLEAAVDDADLMIDLVDAQAGITIDDNSDDGSEGSFAGKLFGTIESLILHLELFGQRDEESTEIVEVPLVTNAGRELLLGVAFESSQALDLEQFNVVAIDLDNDPGMMADVQARLPVGVTIPTAFPVLVKINTGSAAEQAFRGRARFQIETDELSLVGGSPLRLFKANNNLAPFLEITETYGFGSFRVRGAGGQFSQLLIGNDLRSIDEILTDKFSRLTTLMDTYESQIGGATFDALSTFLAEADTAFGQQEYEIAQEKVENFFDKVEDESGGEIPDIWHITEERTNVAALLSSASETLIFSLEIKQTPEADPADANRDGVVDEQDVFYVINRVYPEPVE